MPTNDFKPFAAGAGANVLTQAEYLAQSTVLANGVSAGIASSKLFNKNLRQASIGTKVLTDFISNKLNVDTLDDGTTDTLTSNLHSAVINSGYGDATGSTTAYLANLNPSVLVIRDGDKISVDTGTVGTNTTTSPTLNVNGLGAWLIVKEGGALVVGDMPKFAQLQANFTTSQWLLLNPNTLITGIAANGINVVTATGNITTAMAGGLLRVNSTNAATQTLPAATSYPIGRTLKIINSNSGIVTISRGGSDTITVNNTTVTNLKLALGDTLELISDGVSTWFAVGGTAQLKYSNAFKYGTDYQFFPTGNIIQYGQGTTNAAGLVTVTFPQAFPTQLVRVLTDNAGSGAGLYIPTYLVSSGTTGFSKNMTVANTGAAAPAGVVMGYIAIGF